MVIGTHSYRYVAIVTAIVIYSYLYITVYFICWFSVIQVSYSGFDLVTTGLKLCFNLKSSRLRDQLLYVHVLHLNIFGIVGFMWRLSSASDSARLWFYCEGPTGSARVYILGLWRPEAPGAAVMSLRFGEDEFQAAWRELDEPQLEEGWELFTETMGVKIYRRRHQVGSRH